jgi:hypothetical protein
MMSAKEDVGMEKELFFSELLNIRDPEEIKFNFLGKLGRIQLMWKSGRWIITNKRLIFLADDMAFSGRSEPFASHFRRPLALILLLSEIKDLIKKETKLIVRYFVHTRWSDATLCELGIGFLDKDIQISGNIRYSALLDAIYEYLSGSKTSPTGLICPNCNAPLQENADHCIHCGFSFHLCDLCKTYILDLRTLAQCSFCNSYFHKAEFQNWVKLHARCPICDTGITLSDIP